MRVSARAYLLLPLLLLLIGLALTGPQVARAIFTDSERGGPTTVGTASIASPGSVKAAQTNCKTNKSPEIAIEWPASSSSWVTGYTVERAPVSAGPYTAVTSLANTQRFYTDSSGSLGYSATYYYRVSATFHLWYGASGSVSVKTLSKSCT